MSMPRYSAYSRTSLTAHLKSYCAHTSSPCAGSAPPFQPMSETTATFIISLLSTPPPSATSCWNLASFSASRSLVASAVALAAASAAFAFSACSRRFLAVLRSNDIWRARWKRVCRSFSASSSSFAFCAAAAASAASRSLRAASSAALAAASASAFALAARAFSSRSSLSRFLALYARTSICIESTLDAMYSIRRCSSWSSTPTPRKTFVFPIRNSLSETPALESSARTPSAPFLFVADFGTTSSKRERSSAKGRWSGKPLRVACTACTTPEV
mmetsp:Transcript_20139/g.60257  ORF Transcript_20139/g.60257 Transcript_20139/m.60257 type:complete len:273 (-) Transcript_20139:1566-2384(-)